MLSTRRIGAGLVLAVCLAGPSALTGSSALAASSALGSPATPAAGSFHSWRAAQSAAGFTLLRPSRTYGLKIAGAIHVQSCNVTGKASKHDVAAAYGAGKRVLLGIEQDNSGGPCGNGELAKRLGSYRVGGVTAHLTGICGLAGQRSCRSKKIFLFLTWANHGVYYQAVSHDQGRAALVGFARSLRRVA